MVFVVAQLNAVSELDWTLADVLVPFDIVTLGDAVFRAGTKVLDSSVARTTYTSCKVGWLLVIDAAKATRLRHW